MREPSTRSAARTAALVALPIAVLAGVFSLWKYGAFDGAPGPVPTAAVTMAAPSLSPDVAAVCDTVISHLPASVNNAARRPVTAGSEQNAAYGEPPLTLACGAAEPTVHDTDVLFPVSGVCFLPVRGTDATVWTTVDRVVPIAITVPGPADGSAQSAAPFAPMIVGFDPTKPTIPSGCS